MSPAEQRKAHAGSFGKGLVEAGTSFLVWVKDVVYPSPFKMLRCCQRSLTLITY
ncbi:hypothetical protein [Endozoicomonas numazuensis]|uniref:hypothetical protein n=1 Tax=Endozoicomonas numazuensis TaxID=1137799 RepID=UPI000AC63CBF|nr:hypothetical protein [Endozoicomonas numazuensis]